MSLQAHRNIKTASGPLRIVVLLCTPEPRFLLPGAAPVLVGSSLGFAAAGAFNPVLAVLALVSIVAINAGANMVNDYFDHLSGNDWVNENPTGFGGGSRYIQNGIVTPQAMKAAGLTLLTIGSFTGLTIVYLTGSIFILILGIIGVLGGYFWTAPPGKFCYRYVGEPFIFTLFGLLPVYGSYYLQTGRIDLLGLVPACLVGILICLVLLVNSFGDMAADAAVGKKTLVVRYGVSVGIRVYRILLVAGYVIAAAAIFVLPYMRFAAGLFLLTMPMAVFAIKVANKKNLTTPGHSLANKITLILHSTGSAALAVGFIVYGLCGTTG